nr:hypothetical protein [Tanacetum cinerariifolium]
MVLQLIDITSEITDEELLEFTSEYYIPFALHPVVSAANASIAEFPVGKCYTEKLDALRRWREMFFWVDNALFPWGFAFYTKESLPRDERPTPGSYSMEDAELINENHIPINAYFEAFLCHMSISHNYFHSPEEVPTFISDDGREMDLFSVVHLSKPKLVTEGVRPLRDGEEPLLEATAGRIMKLVLEQPKDENTAVLVPTPLQAAGITRAESETEEVNSGLKRKRATSGDGVGSSKRVRRVILVDSASTEREAMDASPTTAAKDVTETPPPNIEAASNTSAPVTHVEQSLPKTSSFTTDNLSQEGRETGRKVFEGMPADQLMEEIDMFTAHQAALVAQLKARFSSECSRSVQKDEEIALLKAQLADARVEAEASCHWVVKYLEGAKNNHFAGLEEFCQGVEERLEEQEGKLRKLSIKYDEELYPHLVSSITKRRWLISHGLRLAAMCNLESPEVKQSFGDVVKCALANGRAEAVEELHENKLLTVPAAQAILCGVGAAHLPRSDGVPVSVATMSPRDSDLLEKLKEARNATYQVYSSERGRSHSV